MKLSRTRHLSLGKAVPKQSFHSISSSNKEDNVLQELPDKGYRLKGNLENKLHGKEVEEK